MLIDPAAHYGDRELEMAYTTMWGGFAPGFYHAYKRTFPLPEGYEERGDLYTVHDLLLGIEAGDLLLGRRLDEIITLYVGYMGLSS